MSDCVINDPEQVRDIKKLRWYLADEVGMGGRDWRQIPEDLLKDLELGELGTYGLSADDPGVRVRFLCGENDYMSIDYGKGRYQLKLFVEAFIVRVMYSRDRMTGRPIEPAERPEYVVS